MKNQAIRQVISNYLKTYGPQDCRELIDKIAKRCNTTKQRISGNISAMVCIYQTASIKKNYPHSIIY